MIDPKKQRKIDNDPTKHYPNSNEFKMLRKLMSENNLSEVEVRNIKKYRKMLSEAASKVGCKTSEERCILSILKSITKELKLPKSHPDVIKKFKDEIETNTWGSLFNIRYNLNYYIGKYMLNK